MIKIEKNSLPAVLLCGHGSRSAEGTFEFRRLLQKVQAALPSQKIEGAFLEFNAPTILAALQGLYDHGAREIIVQPLTLYKAGHTINDIPEILENFKRNHPDVRLHYGSYLGLSPPVIDSAVQAIKSVLPEYDLDDCKLLVVGRGSKDRMVADQTINLCRKLHDIFDFGDSRYCYSFESAPLLPKALIQAAQSHYPHVVVLPFLLFSGRLLSGISAEVDKAAMKYKNFTFHQAPPLGTNDHIVKAIIQRITAAIS